jgi:hypothetical protein
MRKHLAATLYFVAIFLVATPITYAESIKLKILQYEALDYGYYPELIEASLASINIDVEWETASPDITMASANLWLIKGEIDLHWFMHTKVRDQQHLAIPVGLTENLISNRILLIAPGSQQGFDNISNLDDFRNSKKTAGFGKDWYDIHVWEHNNLAYYEHQGKWQNLGPMLLKRNRGIDYVSFGINQIQSVMTAFPGLKIEENLLLTYDNDFQFYVSKHSAHLHPILLKALLNAKKIGLINKLGKKYWQEPVSKLNLDQRIKLKLKPPS